MSSIEMNDCLVAFIDVLGFGNKVLNVTSNLELQEIHKTIARIHDVFSKVPRDDFDRYEAEVSRRTVLALSDALVIATDLHSPMSQSMGVFDNLSDEIFNIGINQANCAANGIFLRGGLSKGQFFFSDDILVSKAMVRAYKLESEKAKFPIICVDDETYDFFRSHSGRRNYASDIDPFNDYFASQPLPDGSTLNFIDYLRIGTLASFDEFTKTDKEKYFEAQEEDRERVRNEIIFGHAKRFILRHKTAVENEIEQNQDSPSILEKYTWLKQYHNSVVSEFFQDEHDLLVG